MSESHWCQCANCTAERIRDAEKITRLQAQVDRMPVSVSEAKEALELYQKEYVGQNSPKLWEWAVAQAKANRKHIDPPEQEKE
jgi:hypothetical protein